MNKAELKENLKIDMHWLIIYNSQCGVTFRNLYAPRSVDSIEKIIDEMSFEEATRADKLVQKTIEKYLLST